MVDRGFTQCDTVFELYHPEVMKRNTTQFTAHDANQSRLETFNRNTVERFFGRLQRWKIFSNKLDNHYLPKCGGLYRILCATNNRFKEPLVTEHAQSQRDSLTLLSNLNVQNQIIENLKTSGWRRCSEIDALEMMPIGTLEELRDWEGGPYAMKLSLPYIQHSQGL